MAERGPVIGSMPLVGRLGVLDRMVIRLSTPVSTAFVLTGSAAVGKTRLASQVASAAFSTRVPLIDTATRPGYR